MLHRLKILAQRPYLIVPSISYFGKKLCGLDPKVQLNEQSRLGYFVSFSEFWLNKTKSNSRDFEIFARVFRTVGRDDGVAIDVGANIGATSLGLCQAGFKKVFAFEPIIDTRRRLQKNLLANNLDRYVSVMPLGLSDRRGTVHFVSNTKSAGQNRIASDSDKSVPLEEAIVERLDVFFGLIENMNIVLLKIDVEGFEPLVISGGEDLLREGRVAFLFIEVIEKALQENGWTVDKFEKYLKDIHFIPVVCHEKHFFQEVTMQEALVEAGDTRNVLLRHADFR